MRYLSIVFLFALLPVFPSHADEGGLLTPRPLDAVAADTFARARARSAMVRSLVATLERSNVIVHIEISRLLPSGIGGTTRFVVSRGGYRYLRIAISADLSKTMKEAILGHELQHACEVALSGADDAITVRRLFEREGQQTGDFFETRAAVDTERQVRLELRSSRVLQAEPVVKFDH